MVQHHRVTHISFAVVLGGQGIGIAGQKILEPRQVHAFAAGEDYEKANREGAFILAHNRYSVVSIGVDTTNPDLLKLAIDLQATIFNLGGARPPIENIGPRVPPGSTNLMWRMIYFVQDLRSMGEQPLYTVAWEHLQPGYSMNCPKRLRITYRDVESAREAIEAILKKEFGIGLNMPDSTPTLNSATHLLQ